MHPAAAQEDPNMGAHPLNLALRFLLELAALASMALWGWQRGEGWTRFLFALLIPIVAAALWGTFAVPGDPSRSGAAPVPVSGILRLAIEALVFGVGCWMLRDAGVPRAAGVLAAIVLAHYVISYDRIRWLLQ
jgi:hypothetical protein